MPSNIRWAGQSAVYDFTIYDLQSVKWNDVPGVYVFFKVVNGQYHLVYIGRCGSFLNRLCTAHHKWRAIIANGATHVAALVEHNEARRAAIETDLLARYTTPCNEVLN